MGDLAHLRRLGLNISPDIHQHLIQEQKKVVEEIGKAWFFQYVYVEYYNNGLIKTIERDISWKAVVTIGVLVVIGGIGVYFVGPANVVNAAKEMLKHVLTVRASITAATV
jgi:hypothetical protein